jgi:hypothetical protein
LTFHDPKAAALLLVISVLAISAFAMQVLGASPFDGVYVGSQTVSVTNNQAYCLPLDHAEVNAVDNTVSTKLGPYTFSAAVSSDGSFDAYSRQFGSNSPLHVVGKIMADKLDLDMGGQRCNVHISATKQTSADAGPASAGTRLPFDQCMTKCQQLTSRTKEQCFDSCK